MSIVSDIKHDELLFYKNGDIIMSGGYGIKSMFLNDELSPMRTFNSLESGQAGGKNTDKVSSIFDNLAVPAGLFLINNQRSSLTSVGNYMNSEMLPDNIFDDFMKVIEMDKKHGKKEGKEPDKKEEKEPDKKEEKEKKEEKKKNTRKLAIMVNPNIKVKPASKKTRKNDSIHPNNKAK
jgi:hypothetical protein